MRQNTYSYVANPSDFFWLFNSELKEFDFLQNQNQSNM